MATGNTNGLADLSSLQRTEVIAALAKLQAYNATLAEAVEFFLKHTRPVQGQITVETAVDIFLKAKQDLKRRPAYLRSLKKTYLPPFAKHFAAKVVTNINQRDAEAHLNKHDSWSSSTKKSHIQYLSTFYSFLINQGYAKLNPFKNIEKPKAQTTAPKTIAPEEVILLW